MQLGDYRIEIIPDTEFRLDGGAMFGVVPRVVWERVCPPDQLNRIRLNMNCLFVETPREKILIETGIGEKWTEKQTEIYGIFRAKSFAATLFEKTGCRPGDISIVVNTHLHFDHAGGNTITPDELRTANFELRESEIRSPKSEDRIPVAQFPNARYFVSESEFRHAENPHERDRASYLAENWRPLQQSGQLELKPDVYEVVEGLTIENVRGHSETMQTVCLKRGGETLYGFADLIPTRHHLALPWIMGYDLYPTETLEFKKQILPKAVKENWICLFYHDFEMPLCRLAEKDGKIQVCETLS
jgi:glyoxylase-like metal-dependent hydrolase (beta-lactamase superfamily II)